MAFILPLTAFTQRFVQLKPGIGLFVRRLGSRLPAEKVVLPQKGARRITVDFQAGEREARIVDPGGILDSQLNRVFETSGLSPFAKTRRIRVEIVSRLLSQPIPQDGNEPALSVLLPPPSAYTLFVSTSPQAAQTHAYRFNLRRFKAEKPDGRQLYAIVEERPADDTYDPTSFPGSLATGVQASTNGLNPSAFLVMPNGDTGGNFEVTFNQDCAGRTYIFYYVWVNAGTIKKQRGTKVGTIEFGVAGS